MIHTTRAALDLAAVTHTGIAGKQNEDRLSVSSYRVSQNDPTLSVFAIVLDGIGVDRAGEVAAEMAVEAISHVVAQPDTRRPLETLDNAIQVTSEAIASKGEEDVRRLGMGTTVSWTIIAA
jgi:serine/threonine protein phosphatase PrpC